jgi:hypothetical protein
MKMLNSSTVMSPDRDIGFAGLAVGMDITPFPERQNVWST